MPRYTRTTLSTQLTGPTGYSLDLGSDIERARLVGGLASSAHSFLNTAVSCLLAGLEREAMMLLDKATEWLQAAVDTSERPRRYFPGATEAARLYDLVLASWLSHDTDRPDLLKTSILHRSSFFDAMKRPDRVELGLVLVQYLDAEEFNAALRLIRRSAGAKGHAAPGDEVGLCEAFALAAPMSEEKLIPIADRLDRFLHHHTVTWVDRGETWRVAAWMKLRSWKWVDFDHRITAAECVQQAIGYLEGWA